MIRAETRGAARVLTVDRPHRKNALDDATVEALSAAIEEASADPAVRGVILCATGDVFLSGGDLRRLGEWVDDPEGADRVLAMGRRLDVVDACEVPIVAAVTGSVYGGGCEVLLACDFALAEPHVELAFRHARMGLCPAWGATERLVARAGRGAAARLLYTAEAVSAAEAALLGLVEVVPRGGALAAAEARVAAIALAGREVITEQRRLIRAAPAAEVLRAREHEAFRRLWGGPDHRRAMSAFSARGAKR